MKKNRYRYYR